MIQSSSLSRRGLKYLLAATAMLILLLTGCSTNNPFYDQSRLFDPRAIDQQGPSLSNLGERPQVHLNTHRPKYEAYKVGVGDVLDVEIAGFPTSRTRTFVLPDGTIYFDLAEALDVEGFSLAKIKQLLEKELSRRYAEPEIHINLIESKSRRVMILGQIAKPGTYSITQPTTLLQGIANAGGLSVPQLSQTKDLADLNNAVLIRAGEFIPLDFEALIKNGDMSQNVYLKADDYIFIPSSNLQNIHVLGAVGAPQSIQYTSSTTMISAIARVNGALPIGHLDRTILIRGSLKKPQIATVNVNNILAGRESNFVLKPGDIVWVPDRPWEPLERYIYKVIDSAARTIAVNEGARAVDEDATATISISASGTP